MNKRWIEAAGVRAVKTMAQTAIATIGTAAQAALATSRRKQRLQKRASRGESKIVYSQVLCISGGGRRVYTG